MDAASRIDSAASTQVRTVNEGAHHPAVIGAVPWIIKAFIDIPKLCATRPGLARYSCPRVASRISTMSEDVRPSKRSKEKACV